MIFHQSGVTRQKCIIPLKKSAFIQSAFSMKAAHKWNAVPVHIRELTTYRSLFQSVKNMSSKQLTLSALVWMPSSFGKCLLMYNLHAALLLDLPYLSLLVFVFFFVWGLLFALLTCNLLCFYHCPCLCPAFTVIDMPYFMINFFSTCYLVLG